MATGTSALTMCHQFALTEVLCRWPAPFYAMAAAGWVRNSNCLAPAS